MCAAAFPLPAPGAGWPCPGAPAAGQRRCGRVETAPAAPAASQSGAAAAGHPVPRTRQHAAIVALSSTLAMNSRRCSAEPTRTTSAAARCPRAPAMTDRRHGLRASSFRGPLCITATRGCSPCTATRARGVTARGESPVEIVAPMGLLGHISSLLFNMRSPKSTARTPHVITSLRTEHSRRGAAWA